MNLGTQEQTNSAGDVLGTFRSYMAALAMGYSTTLNPHSSIGFNFKVFHQRLADTAVEGEGSVGGSDEGSSTDIAFDIGYLLKFGKAKKHNFGLAIQNIGPPIDFVDAEQADPAPTNMKIGFDFLLHSTENTKINVLFDMNKLLVASYQAMDWDGNGYINGSNADPNGFSSSEEQAHKDEWYKGVFNAWLDDWYYGGDYDLCEDPCGQSASDLDLVVLGSSRDDRIGGYYELANFAYVNNDASNVNDSNGIYSFLSELDDSELSKYCL